MLAATRTKGIKSWGVFKHDRHQKSLDHDGAGAVHLARSLVSPHQSADVMVNAQQMRGMLEANRRRPGPRPYPTRGQTAAMKKPVRP